MTKNKLNQLGVAQALQLLARKEILPIDLLDDCLSQIEQLNPTLHAWVCYDKSHALEQLAVIEERKQIGKPLPLYGIPVGVKDVMNTYHFPNQMGSPIWKDFIPGNDARIISNLKLDGAYVLGKTTTAEFAVHAFNKAVNPHNPRYATGTSSSGSAAAVASGMVPVALGTQTAGSIIRPSSYCGVFGFKPSFGIIPRTGVLKTTDSLDQIGFMVRFVEDLKPVLDSIRIDGLDYPIANQYLNDVKRQHKSHDRLRIGVIKNPLTVMRHAKPYVTKALLELEQNLRKDKGVEVVDIVLDAAFNDAHDIHTIIYERNLAYYFKDEYAQDKRLFSPVLSGMIERGQHISLEQFLNALDRQRELAKKLDMLLTSVDAVITYTTAQSAMRTLDEDDLPDTCLIWTLCGVPVINVPQFKDNEGMPFGVQVFARRYNDYLLINVIKELAERGILHQQSFPSLSV